MNIILYIILGILFLYLICAVFFFLKQHQLLYRPTREIEFTPNDFNLLYEELFITTGDKITLNAWYIPSERTTKKTVLYCHGNSGNISHRLETIKIFHSLNLNVLIFDYRGYGKSDGKPTEKGTYKDADAVWSFLINKKQCTPDNIIIFGRSLGGAIAIELAQKHNAGRVIIESTFTSVIDMTRKLFPLFSVSCLIINKYLSVDKIDKINSPILIIHSKEDSLVPFEHGIRLYKKATSKKYFLEIIGSHNEGFLLSGTKYIDELKRFIFEKI